MCISILTILSISVNVINPLDLNNAVDFIYLIILKKIETVFTILYYYNSSHQSIKPLIQIDQTTNHIRKMTFSVFARPSSRDMSLHAIAAAIQTWAGKQVSRIDCVDAVNGAFYCFVHFDSDEMQLVAEILAQQQVHVPAIGGWVTIGQNKSGGYDPKSPDRISHLIFANDETYFVYRENWACYMWSAFEESWAPCDIVPVAAYVPDMPATELSQTIFNFINVIVDAISTEEPQLASNSSDETVSETQSSPEVTEDEAVADSRPVRRKKTKRFMKTPLEIALLRHIFA